MFHGKFHQIGDNPAHAGQRLHHLSIQPRLVQVVDHLEHSCQRSCHLPYFFATMVAIVSTIFPSLRFLLHLKRSFKKLWTERKISSFLSVCPLVSFFSVAPLVWFFTVIFLVRYFPFGFFVWFFSGGVRRTLRRTFSSLFSVGPLVSFVSVDPLVWFFTVIFLLITCFTTGRKNY